MSIESGSRVVGLVLASWCASAFAGGELADPTVGGDWNADATWSGGVRPQSGEEVTVTPVGDITLTMSADDETDYKQLYFRASSGAKTASSVEFDGCGNTLLMPSTTGDVYSACPFRFLAGDGSEFLSLEGSGMGSVSPVKMDDPHFTLAQSGEGTTKLTFHGGTCNVYDPDGTPDSTRAFLFGSGAASAPTVVFEGSSSLRAWDLCYRFGGSAARHLAFRGGSHEILGTLKYPDAGTSQVAGPDNVFEVSGSAKVVVSNMTVNSWTFSDSSRRFVLDVKDGGALTLGSLEQTGGDHVYRADDASIDVLGDFTLFYNYWDSSWTPTGAHVSSIIEAVNGGDFRIRGNFTSRKGWGFALNVISNASFAVEGTGGYGADAHQSSTVTVVDSSVSNAGAAAFGQNYKTGTGVCALWATNSTFAFGDKVGFYHASSANFTNCTIVGATAPVSADADATLSSWGAKMTFEDCVVTNLGTLRIGQESVAGEMSEMTVDGGTYLFGRPQLGYQAGSCGRLVVKGGARFEFCKSGDSNWGENIGCRGTGIVDVVSGWLLTPMDTYCQLRVGRFGDNSGVGFGRLNVYDDGKVEVRFPATKSTATDGLVVGGIGHGEVFVYGGEVKTPRIGIGGETTKLDTESFVRQTGGRVIVDSENSSRYSHVALATYWSTAGGQKDDRDVCHRASYYLEGGILEAAQIFGGKGSACQGGTGYSRFSADGGTFRLNVNPSTYCALSGLDCAEFGPKGLTFDSNGFDVKIEQDLLNKEGEDGLFVKTGAGALTYSGDCSVSKLVVSNGTWLFAADATCASALTVAPGAELSFVGASTGVEVSAFALENATLSLDPGDQIVVDGDAVVRDLTLRFSAPLTKDDTQTVFVVKGTLDAESAAAIRRAYCPMSVADGTHVQFRVKTAGGVTTITVAVEDDADPIGDGDTMVWTGSGSWSEPANWSPTGTPNETKKAAFTSAAAGKEVEVGTAAVVGALTFGEDGFSLTGEGSLEIAGDRGAAQIEATAGENEVAVPMAFDSVVMMPIGEGAKLTLSGPISYGGFRKTGEGELRLEGDNSFIDEVTLAGGKVSIGGDSLGGTVPIPVRIEGGLVDVERADAAPITMTRPLNPDAGDVPLVFNVKSDVSFPLEYTSGRLFKRGIGTMEMSLADRQQLDSGIKTLSANSWGIAFDERGYVDEENTQLSGAITVAEGKMRIVAKPGLVNKPLLRSNKGVFVGGQCASAQASAELELVGVQLYLPNETSFLVGGGMTMSDSASAPNPAFRLKDADVTSVYYPKFGYRTTAGITPTFSMTNSSFIGRVQTYFGGESGATSMRFEAIDSKLEVGEQILITCGLSADVTNTIVSANDGNCGAFRGYNSYGAGRLAQGYFRLAAGSDFRMNEVSWSESLYIKDFKLVFDDATWTTGDVDMQLTLEAKRRSDGAAAPVDPNVFSIELQKGGLKLPVAAGRTFMTDCRFWGEGGIAKSGEGTLKFGPGAYQFKGPMCALAGTVDLSGAGTITNGCFGAGAGTIADGTLRDPVFRLDAGAPNLVNCTFAGRGYLDVGDEPLEQPYPTDMTVLRFTGTAPDVSNWRLKGAGKKGLGAKFTVVGNEVKVTIEERGLLLLVR